MSSRGARSAATRTSSPERFTSRSPRHTRTSSATVVAADYLVLALRALAFVAVFQAAGGVLFLWRLGEHLDEATAERVRSVTRLAAAAALILTVVHYVLTPARMAGS